MRTFTVLLIGLSMAALRPLEASAVMTQLTSTSQITGPTISFNAAGPIFNAADPYGLCVGFDIFSTTQAIDPLLTGNASAPISPPRAMKFRGPVDEDIEPSFFFEFDEDFPVHAIGVSATGTVVDQPTTFRVTASDGSPTLPFRFDVTMTPTTSGIAGLSGGAVFLGVSSTLPITGFMIEQLDVGFGILDELRLEVAPIPEPSTLILAACGAVSLLLSVRRRHRHFMAK